MTDPNSLYRKLFNRDVNFFLWVIEREKGPILIKIHVQANSQRELKQTHIRRSVMALLPVSARKDKNIKIQVQFFTKKR